MTDERLQEIRECGVANIHHVDELLAEVDRLRKPKMAPVQGYAAGIPWALHLRAYDAYCKRYGKQQSLIEGSCRGGFGVTELDEFVPGWREELSELHRLREEVEQLRRDLAEFEEIKHLLKIGCVIRGERIDKATGRLIDPKTGQLLEKMVNPPGE